MFTTVRYGLHMDGIIATLTVNRRRKLRTNHAERGTCLWPTTNPHRRISIRQSPSLSPSSSRVCSLRSSVVTLAFGPSCYDPSSLQLVYTLQSSL